MEYTDWYDHDIKPVRVGIYEIEDFHGNEPVRCFAMFDGKYFGYAVWSDEGIIDVEGLRSASYTNTNHADTWTNGCRWRGVKEELKF